MHGDFYTLVKSAQKICQNRPTHLCIAMVNRLGDSDESPKMAVTLTVIFIEFPFYGN